MCVCVEVFSSSLSPGPFRCAQLGVRATKLDQHLEEEKEMNSCLRANQTHLQTQLAEEKRRGIENGEEAAVLSDMARASDRLPRKSPKLLRRKT